MPDYSPAEILAGFYEELRDNGVPRRLAGAIVRDAAREQMMQDGLAVNMSGRSKRRAELRRGVV